VTNYIFVTIYRKFVWTAISLIAILVIGTVGYWFVGEQRYSVLDAFYMTVITIATIGYGEIIDMSNKPVGRIFTVFIAFSGIGILTYIFSSFTAFVVEGELNEAFRRRKMEKIIKKMRGHYIICGIEGVGFHIVGELYDTNRPHVVVCSDSERMEKVMEAFKENAYIEGDPTDSDTLLKAGIESAIGLFAVTDDDNQNLVVSLTAKQINPNIKVVAGCYDLKNIEKMKKAGADTVVSPTYIGGLRMASEMVRPAVVSFLDTMLRDKEKNLRIEEIAVPESSVGKAISDFEFERFRNTLLLAARTKEDWLYNPPKNYIIKSEDRLIVMTTPEELQRLEGILSD
jgi:voltage-gated potassium channel